MNKYLNFKNNLFIFIVLSSFSFYLRSFTWDISTIDWDETTYLIMGESILRGYTPYKDYWDLKPMGIYYLSALFIILWNYTIYSIRISSFIFVVILSYSIYLILKNKSFISAVLSGMSLIVLFLIYPLGLSGNTEIYFLTFETLGVYFFFSSSYKKTILGAFLLGTAFLIKYIIVFDLLFFYILKFYLTISNKKFYQNFTFTKYFSNLIFKKFILLGFFTILPLLLTGLHFLFFYEWKYFISSLISVLQKHQTEVSFNERFIFIYNFLKFYILVFIFLLILIVRQDKLYRLYKNRIFLFSIGWLLTSSIGAIWTGFLYDHYLLSIIPSICILLYLSLSITLRKNLLILAKYKMYFNYLPFVLIILVLYIGIRNRNQLIKIVNKIEDYPYLIANHIKKRGGGSLFVASGNHATYVLLNQLPPVKYVQPNNYSELIFSKNFQISTEEIKNSINSNIKYIQWCDEFSPLDILSFKNIDENKYNLSYYKMISKLIIVNYIEDDEISKTCKLYIKKE